MKLPKNSVPPRPHFFRRIRAKMDALVRPRFTFHARLGSERRALGDRERLGEIHCAAISTALHAMGSGRFAERLGELPRVFDAHHRIFERTIVRICVSDDEDLRFLTSELAARSQPASTQYHRGGRFMSPIGFANGCKRTATRSRAILDSESAQMRG